MAYENNSQQSTVSARADFKLALTTSATAITIKPIMQALDIMIGGSIMTQAVGWSLTNQY